MPLRMYAMDWEMDRITRSIIGAAIEVHREMGPGLLESVYEECLAHELDQREIPYQRQYAVPLRYKGIPLSSQFRLDFFVNNSGVVELKTVDKILPIHEAQALTYLRLTGSRVGLIMNFKTPVLKQGIKRLANNY